MTTRRQIGNAGVDAGVLMIIDPCYIKSLPILHSAETWDRFCKEILWPAWQPPNLGGEIPRGGGGVLVNTGGDGAFPVYATYDEDGMITKVEIVFVPDGTGHYCTECATELVRLGSKILYCPECASQEDLDRLK